MNVQEHKDITKQEHKDITKQEQKDIAKLAQQWAPDKKNKQNQSLMILTLHRTQGIVSGSHFCCKKNCNQELGRFQKSLR